jgi:hypothetical protein
MNPTQLFIIASWLTALAFMLNFAGCAPRPDPAANAYGQPAAPAYGGWFSPALDAFDAADDACEQQHGPPACAQLPVLRQRAWADLQQQVMPGAEQAKSLAISEWQLRDWVADQDWQMAAPIDRLGAMGRGATYANPLCCSNHYV